MQEKLQAEKNYRVVIILRKYLLKKSILQIKTVKSKGESCIKISYLSNFNSKGTLCKTCFYSIAVKFTTSRVSFTKDIFLYIEKTTFTP